MPNDYSVMNDKHRSKWWENVYDDEDDKLFKYSPHQKPIKINFHYYANVKSQKYFKKS